VVEIVAIVAAGIWAFYVFIYENRIKPSFTQPQINVGATLQETSRRSGAVGVLLKTEVRNVGAVRFYFVGYSVTVLGTRLSISTHPLPPSGSSLSENTDTFFRLSKPVKVYAFGFITNLGNPASPQGGLLEPGGSIEQEHTFFIPSGRFDLLYVHVSGCFTKFDRAFPARLEYRKHGVTTLICNGNDNDLVHLAYDVGSLDLRK
jgi:hypothetical protein